MGKGVLGEELGIDDEMEMGMPLLARGRPRDFKGVEPTFDNLFPIDVSPQSAEGLLEGEDLSGEGLVVGAGSKGDKFGSIECRHQLKNADEEGPGPCFAAEGADSGFAATFGDAKRFILSVHNHHRLSAAGVEPLPEASSGFAVLRGKGVV